VSKAQLAYLKTRLAALGSCVDGVLKVRVPFENGLATQEDFDAGITKTRAKCAKSFAKVTAASTKLDDAVVKACTPVEAAVVGPYDALRFQAAFDMLDEVPATVAELAGRLCTMTSELADTELWTAAPRLMELLGYLGPEFVLEVTAATSAFPNVALDPRCPPLLTEPPPAMM
jgi:hypothetical protein